MKKKSLVLLSSAAAVLSLAACSSNNSSASSSSSSAETVSTKNPISVTNEGTPISGGTLRQALVSASTFKGIFADELYSDNADATILTWLDESMFAYGSDRKLNNKGLASVEFNAEAKTATVKLNGKDYKWSDGQPFTIDDYIFTIEGVVGPDYPGPRYTSTFKNIVGAEEFHSGSATSISGVQKVDDYTAVITFKEMSPSMQFAGGGMPAYVMPKHIFSQIPASEWMQSEYVRGTKVVGMGAFIIESITPGEAVTMKANPNYYKGKPKIDGVTVEVVAPASIVSEMKAGNYDVASMPTDQYTTYADLSNITLLGAPTSSYEYIAFNLGTYDEEKEVNVYNPNAKMANKSLRQAIGYAIDNDAAGNALYNGLLRNSNSLIIPFFTVENDENQKGYVYDPEKSKALLDDAGYKDVDGDGFREDPNGQPLVITLGARKRTEANEGLIAQYIEWWKAVGLNVQLYNGATMEINSYYDVVQLTGERPFDMFIGGWGTGYDPNPRNLYGESAEWNFSRFVSDENTKLLEALSSIEAFDATVYKNAFYDWQHYAFDEAFAIPTLTGESVTAVNKRVKYWSLQIGDEKADYQLIELTADKGVAEN